MDRKRATSLVLFLYHLPPPCPFVPCAHNCSEARVIPGRGRRENEARKIGSAARQWTQCPPVFGLRAWQCRESAPRARLYVAHPSFVGVRPSAAHASAEPRFIGVRIFVPTLPPASREKPTTGRRVPAAALNSNRKIPLLESRLTLSKQTIGAPSNRNKSGFPRFTSIVEPKPRRVLASRLSGPESAPSGLQGYRVHRANAGGGVVMLIRMHGTKLVIRIFPTRNACPGSLFEPFREKCNSANRGET